MASFLSECFLGNSTKTVAPTYKIILRNKLTLNNIFLIRKVVKILGGKMGKNDKKDPKEKLKVDDYFKDAPTDEEPETEGWNETDQKAADLLEQAFQVWTIVETDEENEIEYRKPTKKKQIEKSQLLIDEARELNSSDEWVKNRVVELQEVVDSGKRKVWDGNRILMIAAALYAIFFFLIPGFGSFKKSDTTLEYAQRHKDGQIAAQTSNISYLEKRIEQLKLPAEQNPNYTEVERKSIYKLIHFTKDIMSPEWVGTWHQYFENTGKDPSFIGYLPAVHENKSLYYLNGKSGTLTIQFWAIQDKPELRKKFLNECARKGFENIPAVFDERGNSWMNIKKEEWMPKVDQFISILRESFAKF